MTDLPTTCRECDERERTFNTFRCPECHPDMTPDDHPPLATEYASDDGDRGSWHRVAVVAFVLLLLWRAAP